MSQLQDAYARATHQSERIRRLGSGSRESPYTPPVPQGLVKIGPSCPLGCAPLPARRCERFTRLFPVIGDQSGLLVELVGVDLFECARQCGVNLRASVRELRVVGDLLGQRVLEAVLQLGVESFLHEELVCVESAQRSR